jgi:hypothetical protein
MTPEQFLQQWKLENIDSGTQPSEIAELSDKLLADAEGADISPGILKSAAGGNLGDFIARSIRKSIEEELR